MHLPSEVRVIVEVDASPASFYDTYTLVVRGILADFGGHYLVRNAAVEALIGEPPVGRLDILGFPDLPAAQAFLEDEELLAIASINVRARGPQTMKFMVSPSR